MTADAGATAAPPPVAPPHDAAMRHPEVPGRAPSAPGRSSSGRPVRVAHFIDGFGVGGTELNLVRTLERLDRERVTLLLVALAADGPLRARVEQLGVPVHTFPIPNMYGPTTMRQAARVIRLLREWGADVVHAHDCYSNIFATACARGARVPRLITSRRWWAALPRRAYDVGNRVAYRLSDHVLANSESVGALVCAETRLPAHRIAVVPNFLDDEAFTLLAPAARADWRAALGIPADAPVVGVVAQLRPEKDLGTLVEAIHLLAAAHPAARLVLVGAGGCQGELEEAARARGMMDRVLFTGYLPNVPSPHQLFDVSVLCSLHEGSPNTLIEAMAVGRPVVATAVGGIVDLVQHGRNGLLVPPTDAPALAAAIGSLLGDPDARARLGAQGREDVRRRHGAAGVLARLEALYTEHRAVA